MIDTQGRVDAYTGKSAVAAAGHVVGEQFSAQANMMANDKVLAGHGGGVSTRPRATSPTACSPRWMPRRPRAVTRAGASRPQSSS